MSEEYVDYFNFLIDKTTLLSEKTLSMEREIFSLGNQGHHYSEVFKEEISDLKDLIHDLNIFIDGLSIGFKKYQESGSYFVTKEELEEIQTKVDRIDFVNLIHRKDFMQKILKLEKAQKKHAIQKK